MLTVHQLSHMHQVAQCTQPATTLLARLVLPTSTGVRLLVLVSMLPMLAQMLFQQHTTAQSILLSITLVNYVLSSTIGAQEVKHVNQSMMQHAQELFLNISIAHCLNTLHVKHVLKFISGVLNRTNAFMMENMTDMVSSPLTFHVLILP
jgi:phage-related holin